MEQPAPAFVPALDHAHLLGPVSSDLAGAVRKAPKNILPEEVTFEIVGQEFRLREPFTDSAINVPAAEVVTVTSWDNASSTVEGIQTKLKVSQPGDMYEQEADRVAEKIVSMTDDNPIASTLPHNVEKIDRKCAKCDMEEEKKKNLTISRNSSNGLMPNLSEGITSEITNVTSSSGLSLDNDVKHLMESRFGYNFDNVRIHHDSESAESINASAYTIGEDIVFGKGRYSTREGQRLLAHELVHVIQQNQNHQIGSELAFRGPPPRTSTKGRTVSNPELIIRPMEL